MSNSYHTLKIADITRETSDAVTLHFEQPQNQTINYKPGQFLTLIIPFEGKKERRSYSLSSTPHENTLSVTIKRVPGGKVSNYLLDNAAVGQEIEIMEPLGNFCITCDAAETRNVILLGAGSGITPLMSILKGVLREEPNSKVTLLYGNRDENSVIFKDQLEQLRAENPDRLQIAYIYSQPKQNCEYRGRMNQSLMIKILERLQLSRISNGLYFMCGPEGMMDEVKKALNVLHVPSDKVFRESFVSSKLTGEPDSNEHGNVSATDEDEITTQTVTIIYEGSEYSVTVNPDQTILEAALDQDVDLPYSCQAGLCTACRGKCLSGKVHLDEREGLSDAELDEGYVLNCVGHPLTSDVVIEIG
ncbi:ferredoxin--NADP reductase [Pontibacter sp. BT310]|uniref:Ferredoxin--NADP reductase n=1 Tax=Pontibacter populi TaxID=890055 RepID=A0ABS6XD33_9BACT|nr:MULTISPECIES: ferredoxin--NADP reductase [Pontibacter]MBJ6118564.1 ferredoxin--NADP reductase [Pontibacter sp. BT310]MBR0570993.1 ferredoxin--NADP reductase [Microvirga sp. STS03]MBW3365418.1 ferredoxin--NADP reductase [Pontibacter populi]